MQAVVKLIPVLWLIGIPAFLNKLFIDTFGNFAVGVCQLRVVPTIALDPLGSITLN